MIVRNTVRRLMGSLLNQLKMWREQGSIRIVKFRSINKMPVSPIWMMRIGLLVHFLSTVCHLFYTSQHNTISSHVIHAMIRIEYNNPLLDMTRCKQPFIPRLILLPRVMSHGDFKSCNTCRTNTYIKDGGEEGKNFHN